MNHARLYLDQAATSWPKAPGVAQSMARGVDEGFSANRGAYTESMRAGEALNGLRRRLALLVGSADPSTIVITSGTTFAINLALLGLARSRRKEQESPHFLCTDIDHNAVLRPMHALLREGTTHSCASLARGQWVVDPEQLARQVKPNTVAIVTNAVSNVTGAIQGVKAVGDLCRSRGLIHIVDAAQAVGHIDTREYAQHAQIIALSAHKGLRGPSGIGALYIQRDVQDRIEPILFGGTGRGDSYSPTMPNSGPERFEPGTYNMPGVYGWIHALEHFESQGIGKAREHELGLNSHFLEKWNAFEKSCRGALLWGPLDPETRTPVFSFTLPNYTPEEVASILEAEFGILVRAGLACAPRALNMPPDQIEAAAGAVRVSLGTTNQSEDIDRLFAALNQMAAGNG